MKIETDVIYMDFKKAFDSLSHNGLLRKLSSVGITGQINSGTGFKNTYNNGFNVSKLVTLCHHSVIYFLVYHKGAYYNHYYLLSSLVFNISPYLFLLMIPNASSQ